MHRAEPLLVPFEGPGSGTDDLSWGQREIWLAMGREKSTLALGGVKPLPAGTTVDDVAEEVRYTIGRYQSMRTRLSFDPDGGPRQVVSASGVIALDVVDADSDPAAVADAVAEHYREREYDFVNDWPVWMAVIRHRGALTHLVAIVSHLVTDGFGGAVMVREVAERMAAPVTASQPLDQVRWQRSPAARRQSDAALRHWAGLLRTMPQRVFAGSADPCQPRYRRTEFRSPATHLAVRAITERACIDSAPVLLALYAIAVGRLSGVNPVVVKPVVHNRFRPGLSDVVSPISQSGLCALDVAGTFDEVLARVRRAAMTAYKYAYYDPARLADLVALVGRERGAEIDFACCFNDRRNASRTAGSGPMPTPDDVRDALPHSRFDLVWVRDQPTEPLFVHVDDVPGTIALTIDFDTHRVAPAQAQACAREMEAVAVAAAFDPAAPTGVPAAGGTP